MALLLKMMYSRLKKWHENPVGNGVCKVEFIAKLNNPSGGASIALVEARRSIPRKADHFFNEIKTKMIHSLTMWLTTVCGRHPKLTPYLPKQLNLATSAKLPIKLVLVIPNVPDRALPPLTDKLRRYFNVDRCLWQIKHEDIRVMNRSRAVSVGLSVNGL